MSMRIKCNWAVVQAIVGNDISESELPNDPAMYSREVGAHLGGVPSWNARTAGVIRYIERHRSMKKEAEFKQTIEKIASQQLDSNAKYERLAAQYEQLLSSYNAMKRAYQAETETTRALKRQLDEILGVLNGTEVMS